jgi:H+/Cl- antiporter ClcA
MYCDLSAIKVVSVILDGGDRPPDQETFTWWLPLISFIVGSLASLLTWILRARRKEISTNRTALVKRLEDEFASQLDIRDNVELLVKSTSTISVGADVISDLRGQIDLLSQRIQAQRNEIVEIQRIDPILEATLKVSVENIAKRLDSVERQALTRWDAALVFLQLLSGIGVIVGAVLGCLKYLQK